MIVDTSVLVAILTKEEELEFFVRRIHGSEAAVGAPTLLETGIVIGARLGPAGLERLDAFVEAARMAVLPFTATHAATARDAFIRYGKGRHQAALNVGDCMSYAIAKVENRPLLFTGEDFSLTDIQPAVAPG
ncbi:MAG: type II toxin-antitoxin system VapC family toxin [Pararhizobium sp.]